MVNEPRTPAELRLAFIAALEPTDDPLLLQAINELVQKIENVYLGLGELTPIERLFGRSLLELMEEE
jgi:hypothetical protein